MTTFPIKTQSENISIIDKIDLRKSKFLLWHLILEQNIFFDYLAKVLSKIEFANRNYLLAKNVRKIKLLYLRKKDSILSKIINNVLYILKAKKNLLFPSYLSKKKENIKITGLKIYLH